MKERDPSTDDDLLWYDYKYLCNLVVDMIHKAKDRYLYDAIDKNHANQAKMWKTLKYPLLNKVNKDERKSENKFQNPSDIATNSALKNFFFFPVEAAVSKYITHLPRYVHA